MESDVGHILERLQLEGEKTQAFFREISPDEWGRTVYTEGAQWTVSQVLAHFVEAEESVGRLIRHIIRGGPGVPEDFDLDGYNARKVSELEHLPPERLLEQFSFYRNQTVAMVAGFSSTDLVKTGRHPFLGVAPVADILKLMYRHNQIHQRDLRRLLR